MKLAKKRLLYISQLSLDISFTKVIKIKLTSLLSKNLRPSQMIPASSLPTLILIKHLNPYKTISKSLKTGSKNGGSKLMRLKAHTHYLHLEKVTLSSSIPLPESYPYCKHSALTLAVHG